MLRSGRGGRSEEGGGGAALLALEEGVGAAEGAREGDIAVEGEGALEIEKIGKGKGKERKKKEKMKKPEKGKIGKNCNNDKKNNAKITN
jgi:hypothetical protein